tara:strand:+ start:732 stop:929 length:198 start_codon:yes stop_codon:yes gene_type:complete
MSNEDDTSYDDGYQQGSSDTAEEFRGKVRVSIEEQIDNLQAQISEINVAINQLLVAKRAIISDMD